MIRLEIWAGIGNERERQILRDYEAVLPELPINAEVWQAACDVASRARRAGKTIPASDILIFACARHHGVDIEHANAHFDMLVPVTADDGKARPS